MSSLEKNEYYELEILKHVEETPTLNNRMAAAKLGCSVKLAHALLSKMVKRGLLHVTKHHARRWDYFLTPRGIAEKARLTYEFIDFSMQFYQEARKASSRLCRDLAENGVRQVAFLGAGDLAEIVYLGVKEWGLELVAVYDESAERFLDHSVRPMGELPDTVASAVIVCVYDRTLPLKQDFLPDGVEPSAALHWLFREGGEG